MAVKRSHHIMLNGVGYMLHQDHDRPAAAGGNTGPVEQTGLGGIEEIPAIWDDFSGGMGYSRRLKGAPQNTYDYALNVCTRYAGWAMPAGALTEYGITGLGLPSLAEPRAFIEQGSTLIVLLSDHLSFELPNNADGSSSALRDFGSGWSTVSATMFNGNVWVGSIAPSSTWGLWKRAPNGTWTSYDSVYRGHLKTVYWVVGGVGAYRLVGTGVAGGSTINHTTGDPSVAASWTAAVTVGDTSYDITALAASNRHVYALRPDGVYDIDARGYTPNLTPYWRQNLSYGSGQTLTFYDGRVVASHREGIDSIDVSANVRQDIPSWIDPIQTLGHEGPIRGVCTALAIERGWLIAAFYSTDGNSYLCYGMPRERAGIPGRGPYVWHGAELVLEGHKISALHVCSLTPPGSEPAPRLFIGAHQTEPAQPKLFSMKLPQFGSGYADWRNGGPMRFRQGTTQLFTGAEDWGDGTARKLPTFHAINGENLAPGAKDISLYSSADNGGYVFQGVADAAPLKSFRSLTVSGHLIKHRLDFFTGSDNNPPILRSLKTRAKTVVEDSTRRHFRVLIGKRVGLKGGARPAGSPLTDFNALKALQYANPVPMVDEWGANLTVKVERGITWKTVEDEQGGGLSRIVDFDVTEMS